MIAMSTHHQQVYIDVDGTEVMCDVTYSFTPAQPAYTPRGEYGPIDPPEPAEVIITSVEIEGVKMPRSFEIALENSDKVYSWMAEHHRDPVREYEPD